MFLGFFLQEVRFVDINNDAVEALGEELAKQQKSLQDSDGSQNSNSVPMYGVHLLVVCPRDCQCFCESAFIPYCDSKPSILVAQMHLLAHTPQPHTVPWYKLMLPRTNPFFFMWQNVDRLFNGYV